MLEEKLIKYSFRAAYGLRYEVPSFKVEEYLKGEVDKIDSVDFMHEKKIKEIAASKPYRETIKSFMGLLTNLAGKRRDAGKPTKSA